MSALRIFLLIKNTITSVFLLMIRFRPSLHHLDESDMNEIVDLSVEEGLVAVSLTSHTYVFQLMGKYFHVCEITEL